MTDGAPGPDGQPAPDSDPDLDAAVEDALDPVTHDAVMAVWQRVVLARLDPVELPPNRDGLLPGLDDEDEPGEGPD